MKARFKSRLNYITTIMLVATIALLAWQFVKLRQLGHAQSQLDVMKTSIANIRIASLNTYFGREQNYDYLSFQQTQLNHASYELVGLLSNADLDSAQELAIEAMTLGINQRVESFKSLNANARNSQRFLTYRIEQLERSDSFLEQQVDAIRNSLLAYLSNRTEDNAQAVLGLLETYSVGNDQINSTVELLSRQFNYVRSSDLAANEIMEALDSTLRSSALTEVDQIFQAQKQSIYFALSLLGALAALLVLTSGFQFKRLSNQIRESNVSLHRLNEELEERISEATQVIRQQMGELEIDRKRADQANEAKSAFLANMSHELRTPLNGISGMAQVLQKSTLNADQSKYVDTILNTSGTLAKIINDILDFSKIEAGKIDIEHIDFDLLALVESTVDELTPAANRAKTQIVINYDSTMPRDINTDPTRITQILRNLLSNAIKFCSRGVVTISITEGKNSAGERVIECAVQDTGVGISDSKLDSVFDAFSQEDETTTRRFGGTGLGLAVTKRLVELLGGDIRVSSKVGFGSRFSFTVPLSEAKTPVIHEKRQGPLTHIKAAIFDTNEVRAKALTTNLESWGLDYLITRDTNTLTQLLESNALSDQGFTCVIIELDALTDQLKETLLSTEFNLPVIPLTPIFQEAVIQDGLGFAIHSPIKPSELMDTLADVHGQSLKSDAKAESEHFDFQGARILLTDDNEVNRMVAELLLEDVNIIVESAEDGQQAVDMLRANHYDAILMDCQMPVMDGYVATQTIRNLKDPKKSNTPIIAMTANALKGDRERCFSAGMNDYISKPVDAQTLYQLLDEWLRTRRKSASSE
ncbi:MAG: response regulator [Gammaproteobacteria bacterium]|nr:response regulator [Gammaproteobacteria bacterium]